MNAAGNARRYSRHLLIPEVGLEGQRKLSRSRVLCVGAGGLGAPVLSYLAAAGVGRVGVMDDDVVDETNLQRQVLFAQRDVGRPKALVAAERLRELNPEIGCDPLVARFDAANGRELAALYDLVVDCTDSFSSKYALNDACVLEGKRYVFGAIFRFDGQVAVFGAGGPCYRCLYPHAPPPGSVPACAEGGVLGVLPGIVGSFQAAEALKIVLGIGEPLLGRLLLVDALSACTRELKVERDPQCAVCGLSPTVTELRVQRDDEPGAGNVPAVKGSELDALLGPAVLLDVREPHECVLGLIPGSVHIPASQLEARLHELDSARTYVVACRVGMKSAWAVRRLGEAGFRRLYHLEGGLLAYAAQKPEFAFF